MKKRYRVEYRHRGGVGMVEVTTEISESGCFGYGNGMAGLLTVGDFAQPYDLRYNGDEDLHMMMIRNCFGECIVSVTEVEQ